MSFLSVHEVRECRLSFELKLLLNLFNESFLSCPEVNQSVPYVRMDTEDPFQKRGFGSVEGSDISLTVMSPYQFDCAGCTRGQFE